MNQCLGDVKAFCGEIQGIGELSCEVWVAPQFIHIDFLKSLAPAKLKVGAQNCAPHKEGAFTGEISPVSLEDMGVRFVILGHSERRVLYGETDEVLRAKVVAARDSGLTVIFCVGESLEEREKGITHSVIKEQLERGLEGVALDEKIILAYEPIWAIGTGKTATPEMAQDVHYFIRKFLGQDELIILYGGSLKLSNASGLLSCPDIDGGLIGGSSLSGADFFRLCKKAQELYTG